MIRPRKNRLVVEPLDLEQKQSPIAIIEFDKFDTRSSGLTTKDYTRGKVLAVGEECDHRDGARVGDVIRFTKKGGLPVDHEGKTLLLISEKDIYGIEIDESAAA